MLEVDLKEKTCSFFGHRKINKSDELTKKLYSTIELLITQNEVDKFLFGSKSQFDDLCWETVTRLKEKYKQIKRIYVRSSWPEISDNYEKYLLESYEETYFPEQVSGAGRASYVKRNQEMINKSKYCVFYYDENYLPPRRKENKRNVLDKQPKSGTGIAYDYAKKKDCYIINVNEEAVNIEPRII